MYRLIKVKSAKELKKMGYVLIPGHQYNNFYFNYDTNGTIDVIDCDKIYLAEYITNKPFPGSEDYYARDSSTKGFWHSEVTIVNDKLSLLLYD